MFDLSTFLKEMSRQYESVALFKKRSKQELSFVEDLVARNVPLLEYASLNPSALRQTLLKASALGVSFSPARKEAIIAVRNGQIILDITYQGLKAIAERSGVLRNVVADNVFAKDTFVFRGRFQEPDHIYDPFAGDARGEFRGVFCVAFFADGTKYVEFLTLADIQTIRQCSVDDAPWLHWFLEMTKKSVIKRAYKSWPRQGGAVLQDAISYLNTVAQEGIQLDPQQMNLLPAAEPVSSSELELMKEQNADFINGVVARAKNTDMWETAYQYACERIQDLSLREYVRNLLDEERKKSLDAAKAA